MRPFYSLLVLNIVAILLVSYNFIQAQWTAPSAVPPSNNTAAPINVSGTMQAKSGNLMANILAAATSTWSPRYCDALGNNCFTAANVVNAISATSTASCRLALSTVRGNRCFTLPTCPAGTVKVDTRQVAMSWCPGDAGDYTYDVDCLQITCS